MRFDTKQFVAHVSKAVLITMLPMRAHLINMFSFSNFADETSATTVWVTSVLIGLILVWLISCLFPVVI